LASRAANPFLGTLIGDLAKKLTLGVLASALIPVVGDDRNEILLDDALNVVIGESERTARDSVVSSTAERMSVHLPQKNWLALGSGFFASFP
jgi:hypothetical protein